MKKISSDISIFYRLIGPTLFGFLTVLAFLGSLAGRFDSNNKHPGPWFLPWLILIGGGLATVLWTVFARNIQEVEMNDEVIKVTGWKGVEEIPFERIAWIEETRLKRPKCVHVQLRTKSIFGDAITFIPSGLGMPFGTHPIVTEMTAAIRKAGLDFD